MHATRRGESYVTLSNGGDLSLIVGFLVLAVDRLNLVHLDRLSNANANFCLSSTVPRTATLCPYHRDQLGRATALVKGTYGHIETVDVS